MKNPVVNTVPVRDMRRPLAVAIAAVLLVACSGAPREPEGLADVRSKLAHLQADSKLASQAPVAIKSAEQAVNEAGKKQDDIKVERHLVYMADRKVEIASNLAQSRLLEDQRSSLSRNRESARLDSRTREADIAHGDADQARLEADELQRQLDALNAKATERGHIVTLGDVLFDTGKSTLKGGASANLDKLAAFLNQYQDRTALIEGHTDSVGSEQSNQGLSERRANAVEAYLVGRGVDSARLNARGRGEGSPVAVNDSATGRQQNRRVEVIISK